MMPKPKQQQDLSKEISELHLKLAPYLTPRIERLKECLHAEEPDLNGMQTVALEIAGAASMLGAMEIRENTEHFNNLLAQLQKESHPASQEEMATLENCLSSMSSLCVKWDQKKEPTEVQKLVLNGKFNNQRLFLVGKKLAPLIRELRVFGFHMKPFADLKGLATIAQQGKAGAVLIDIDDFEVAEPYAELKRFREKTGITVPFIFLAKNDAIEQRIAAVQAGGIAFLRKPFAISTLTEVLEAHSGRANEEAYRVLIVEDSSLQSNFYSLILESVGIQTYELQNPLLILEAINNFSPDVLLMDMYLPGCTGLDLARAYAQTYAGTPLPIIFLSASNNLDELLTVVQEGGDDFLHKPVKPEKLIALTLSRAKRGRQLRRLTSIDPLTKVMNRRSFETRLDAEINRANRTGSPLSVAMVDLDKFKSINDTYGHPTGDDVIRSIAELLKRRLRKSDSVGRLGGEEFAIIFPDTPLENAEQVLNELRATFAQIVHHADGQTFSTTFSSGIAGLAHFTTPESLLGAADRGLYAAKRNGRNRVLIHRPE